MFSYARAGRSASVGRDLERGRPLAERADASTAAGRAQRGTAREREGAFGIAVITAGVRYSLSIKHYRVEFPKSLYPPARRRPMHEPTDRVQRAERSRIRVIQELDTQGVCKEMEYH